RTEIAIGIADVIILKIGELLAGRAHEAIFAFFLQRQEAGDKLHVRIFGRTVNLVCSHIDKNVTAVFSKTGYPPIAAHSVMAGMFILKRHKYFSLKVDNTPFTIF